MRANKQAISVNLGPKLRGAAKLAGDQRNYPTFTSFVAAALRKYQEHAVMECRVCRSGIDGDARGACTCDPGPHRQQGLYLAPDAAARVKALAPMCGGAAELVRRCVAMAVEHGVGPYVPVPRSGPGPLSRADQGIVRMACANAGSVRAVAERFHLNVNTVGAARRGARRASAKVLAMVEALRAETLQCCVEAE